MEGLAALRHATSAPATSTTTNAGKGEKTLTFQPELPAAGKYEVRLAYSPGTSRSDDGPGDGLQRRRREDRARSTCSEAPPIDGRFVSLGQYRFEKNGQGYVLVANEGTKGHVTADAVLFLPVDEADAPPTARSRPAAKPPASDAGEAHAAGSRAEAAPGERARSGTMVMSVVEEKTIEDTRVHVRGSVHNLGEAAPRGFLQVATYGDAAGDARRTRAAGASWPTGSRRPDNPLTARVIVNRAWHWLFGAGLVRTVDNFGTTGETPSHPELLDHLAVRFVEDGWSVKKLVRRIVLSPYLPARRRPTIRRRPPSTRRTACSGTANRRRLDAECIRDTMLSVSGQLRPTCGGPTFPPTLAADYGYKHDRHPPQRLLPGLPQRPAGAVRGVRLRRPEHGRRPARTSARSPRRRCS